MRLVDLFIRRPILAVVVSLIIIIAGLQAVRSLNVRQYPKLEAASIVVNTVYVGASADLVRGFVTTPLEQAIAAADGIDYIESQSVQGLSTISVRLRLNFDGAKALADSALGLEQAAEQARSEMFDAGLQRLQGQWHRLRTFLAQQDWLDRVGVAPDKG